MRKLLLTPALILVAGAAGAQTVTPDWRPPPIYPPYQCRTAPTFEIINKSQENSLPVINGICFYNTTTKEKNCYEGLNIGPFGTTYKFTYKQWNDDPGDYLRVVSITYLFGTNPFQASVQMNVCLQNTITVTENSFSNPWPGIAMAFSPPIKPVY